MVTQAPRRSAVLAAIAFALSCVGLMIFVWTQFGGTIPFAPQGYRIHAVFKESGLLVPGADVRISGVTVGKVSSVQARGVNSYVTAQIRPQYAPLPGGHARGSPPEDPARRGLHRILDRQRIRAQVRRWRDDPGQSRREHAGPRPGPRLL